MQPLFCLLTSSKPPALATLRNSRKKKLSPAATETIEWVKEALNAEHIHPVNTNLLLSSDDSTLFVFEGATNKDSGDWEWKIIDRTQNESSTRSDFEVASDYENS